ncbi:TVP38/TMEM64 family protein [Thermotalea metallivorans]|uniref:TVP38/TMEM64 family membrane protein n=1 Tax=Thermotalea metallivorans TaxID=520762 RepID=A0A140L0F9_9FIRM|nr:TVP38/TMEM64 family protein [Thermotalea metallivorans]KXG74034.1 TVP38/TMEM64 family inner membrane protein YdjZ [Thermotalea metallivorans]
MSNHKTTAINETQTSSGKTNHVAKLVSVLVVLAVVIGLMKYFGTIDYISIENITKLNAWIKGFGAIGPLVYILLYIIACVFFLPGLPIAILAGFVFGPVWGTIYASIGATLGASAAFLIARYAARSMVEDWVQGNEQFKKIDEGVERQGWRMLMITRLVPVFPFNLQNYAYGLTKIKFSVYVLVSWICMLPGAAAFCFAGGSIVSGQGDIKKTFMYLGIAAVFFVIISLIPNWMKKRQQI